MFSLQAKEVKLTNVNPRTEIHGTDHRLACDLAFEVKESNDVLSEFHPELKSAFYKKGDEIQGELLDTPGYLSALKFSFLGSIAWQTEYPGYEIVFHIGIDERSNLAFGETQIDKFRFEMIDGGSVIVRFRAIIHPQATEIGKLCEHIQQNVTLSLTPPPPPSDLAHSADDAPMFDRSVEYA